MNEQKTNQSDALTWRQTAWQGTKFVLFSASAGLIQAAIFTLLYEAANLPYWPAYLVALIASVLYNFTVNRRFTFQSAANVPKAMLQVLAFYLVFTPLSTYLGDGAERAGANAYLVLGATMLLNLLLEYLYCRFVVYKGQMNTNDLANKEK